MPVLRELVRLQLVRLLGLALFTIEALAVLVEKLFGYDVFPDSVDIGLCFAGMIAVTLVGVVEVIERNLARTLASDQADLGARRARERELSAKAAHQRERIENLLESREYPTVTYRPIHELSSGDIVGYAADAHFGPGASEPWFGQAEALGLAGKLELKALQRAWLGLTDAVGPDPDAFLAVPCSVSTLTDGTLAGMLAQADPGRIVLELHESTDLLDYGRYRSAADELRRLGVRFAVAHLRTGHDALRHVLELRPEFVLMDQAVPAADPGGRSTAEILISLCGLTGATVIAGAVPDEAACGRLLELGVALGSGPCPTTRATT